MNQTFTDMEIVFVNDGDDRLNDKLKELSEKDGRVRVIYQNNGGASSARNHGIEVAKGEWLVFVDSDDRMKPYYLQSLFDAVDGTKAEMAVGGFTFNYVKEHIMPTSFIAVDGSRKELPAKEAYRYFTSSLVMGVPWNKIYKRELLIKNNIKYDLSIERIQDAIMNQAVYRHVQYISLIEDCGYIYTMNDSGSLCSSYIKNFEHDEKLLFDLELEIQKQFGYSAEELKEFTISRKGLYAYFLVCNLFKRKSPLTLSDAVKRIKRELFDDEVLMSHYKLWKKNGNSNNFIKIFHFAMATKSPFIVALIFKLQYWMKYQFMGFYLWLKPWLKR